MYLTIRSRTATARFLRRTLLNGVGKLDAELQNNQEYRSVLHNVTNTFFATSHLST